MKRLGISTMDTEPIINSPVDVNSPMISVMGAGQKEFINNPPGPLANALLLHIQEYYSDRNSDRNKENKNNGEQDACKVQEMRGEGTERRA